MRKLLSGVAGSIAAGALVFGAFPDATARAQQPTPPPSSEARQAAVRAEIAALERLLPSFPDRGAILWALAFDLANAGERSAAVERLKECIARGEGFDPSGERAFLPLHGEAGFDAIAAEARRRSPTVANARAAMTVAEKDLIPEGLAYDAARRVFYLSSLHHRKIVRLTRAGRASDLVPAGRDGLLPVLGIRPDPATGTIWANTFEDGGRTELVHFDQAGKLLGRHAPSDGRKHGFNDLVIRRSGEILMTDSADNRVYRFDPSSRRFSTLEIHRPLLYPNGIALATDDRSLFIADALGVVHADLAASTTRDVAPGTQTLAGIDGLYWNRGSLVAVQNSVGTNAIVAFRLAKDGNRVTATTVLERGTSLTTLPTTGAIVGADFYFISNSQIDNEREGRIVDPGKLEPVRIGVVRLPE